MKKKTALVFFLVSLLIFSVSKADLPTIGGGGTGGMMIEGSGKYTVSQGDLTVMLYMIGSNLESDYGAASEDILEIAQSGADFSSLNVVVAAGGASHWHELSIGAGEVGFGTIRRETGTTGIQWDKKVRGSISSESMLSTFLKYAYETYPAKEYALIFWNHGGGPLVGYGHDEVSDNKFSLKQLASALKNSPFSKKQLEWAGFDACLMGSYEVMAALAPYVECMIFSEETEPGSGWDYSFMGVPGINWSGRARKEICDRYAESMQKRGASYTISSVLCGNWVIAQDLLDTIFSVDLTSALRTGLARAAYNSQSFGLVSSNSTYDLYDLVDFVYQLCNTWPLSEKSKKNLKFSADLIVEYNRTNIPGANGLSFYFPLYTEPSRVGAVSIYDYFSLSSPYLRFLKSARGGLAGSTSVTGGRTRTYDGRSRLTPMPDLPKKEITCSWQLTEPQRESLVMAEYALLHQSEDGAYELIRRGDGVDEDETGLLTVSIPDALDVLLSVEGEPLGALTLVERDRSEEEIAYFLPSDLTHEGRELTGSLQYFVRGESTAVGSYVPYHGTDVPPKQLIELSEGDTLEFHTPRYLPAEGEDGVLLPFAAWEKCETDRVLKAEVRSNSEWIGSRPVPWEGYYVQITGTDVDGNRFCSPLMPLDEAFNTNDEEGVS